MKDSLEPMREGIELVLKNSVKSESVIGNYAISPYYKEDESYHVKVGKYQAWDCSCLYGSNTIRKLCRHVYAAIFSQMLNLWYGKMLELTKKDPKFREEKRIQEQERVFFNIKRMQKHYEMKNNA